MLQACVSQALSSEAAALLGDHPPEVQAALQAYGRHLGIAYQVRVVSMAIVKCSSKCFYMPLEYYGYFYYVQLVDDYLDFVGSSASLGKPALSDMDQGLATAPVLFALEEFPQIGDIVKRSPPPAPTRRLDLNCSQASGPALARPWPQLPQPQP